MNTELCIVFHTCLAVIGYVVSQSAQPSLTTTLGTVTGSLISDTNTTNVSVFYGIPYAVPPVGALRFRPPIPARSWEGVRNATRMPNSCWQVIDTAFGRPPQVDMWNPNTNMSEDCLYLNIWIPQTDNQPKAVMVWIYGGGFWGGTSTLNVYNPIRLAAMNNVIVASFNYRTGPFGFLYGGTSDSPGNVGLLDQVLALKWIKENAENMGGDPARITIFGESAGGASVGFHLMSPLSMELFTYAIMMSASPIAHWSIQAHDVALNRTQTLACLLGCSVRDVEATVSYLRTLSPHLLANTQFNLTYTYFDTPFGPVVDGYFLPKHPRELMAEGKVKNTSIITGVVKDEGTYWLLYGFPSVFGNHDPNPVNSSQYAFVVDGLMKPLGPNFTHKSVQDFTMKEYYDSVPPWSRGNYLDALDDICGDTVFKCPVINFAEYYASRIKGQTYVYSFEHRVSTNGWPQWIGVAHGYELEVFFGLPWFMQIYTNEERTLSDDVMTRISNFAKTGNPNSGPKTPTVRWTAYTASEQRYLVMKADSMNMQQGLRYSQCEFWRTQVPLLQKEAAAEDGGRHCPNAGVRLAPAGVLLLLLYFTIIVAAVAFIDDLNIENIS